MLFAIYLFTTFVRKRRFWRSRLADEHRTRQITGASSRDPAQYRLHIVVVQVIGNDRPSVEVLP